VESETATAGAGPGVRAGQRNNPMSLDTVPVQDRLVLMQVDDGMRLYKAEHGRAPATYEEFMADIIQKNHIRLPQLPAGQSYVYEGGELKVRRPTP